MVAISFLRENPLSCISKWLKKETYCRAYQFTINLVKGRRFWAKSEEGPLLPPIAKRMPSKPSKRRKRESLQGNNKGTTKSF